MCWMWLQAEQLVTRFRYLPSYHGDDVCHHHYPTPCMHRLHQHSSTYPQMHAHRPSRRSQTAGLSHVLFSFCLDFTFLIFFKRLWRSFSTKVLAVTPPVLEIMYLCVWRASPLRCPPLLLLCHLLLTHMWVWETQSGVWVRTGRGPLNVSLRTMKHQGYVPSTAQFFSCASASSWLNVIRSSKGDPLLKMTQLKQFLHVDRLQRKQIWVLRYTDTHTHTPHMLSSWDNLLSICLPWIRNRLLLLRFWLPALTPSDWTSLK